MSNLSTWIAQLKAGRYSSNPQELISTVDAAVSALGDLDTGVSPPLAWVPVDASGAGLVFTAVSASYSQIGNMVFAYGTLTYQTTADASNAKIGGLPFPIANQNYAAYGVGFGQSAGNKIFMLIKGTSTVFIQTLNLVQEKNSDLSGLVIPFFFCYPLA